MQYFKRPNKTVTHGFPIILYGSDWVLLNLDYELVSYVQEDGLI